MTKTQDNSLTEFRFKNIEFYWSPTNKAYELRQWIQNEKGEHCIVLAFFDCKKEEFDMKTVGRRFLDALLESPEIVIIVTRYAFDYLEARFRAEQSIRELKPWIE